MAAATIENITIEGTDILTQSTFSFNPNEEGINPEVILSTEEDKKGNLLTATLSHPINSSDKTFYFIVNAETLNAATIQRHDNMRKVAEIYRKVHNSQIRLKNEFNIFQEIEKYDILLQRANAVMYTGWEDVKEKVLALEGYLNNMGVNLCACHNDAVPENFIKAEDGTLYLIDWEYSGVNDPMADFAALFLESDFSEENQDFVLKHYFQGDIPPNTYEKIKCYMNKK